MTAIGIVLIIVSALLGMACDAYASEGEDYKHFCRWYNVSAFFGFTCWAGIVLVTAGVVTLAWRYLP